jgi:hypothetical protein
VGICPSKERSPEQLHLSSRKLKPLSSPCACVCALRHDPGLERGMARLFLLQISHRSTGAKKRRSGLSVASVVPNFTPTIFALDRTVNKIGLVLTLSDLISQQDDICAKVAFGYFLSGLLEDQSSFQPRLRYR